MSAAAVRVLTPSYRDEVAAHLLVLSADDRRYLFGSPFTDAAILGYVEILNFSRDKLFGAFEEGSLVGVAHLSVRPDGASAQLGISIAPRRRGRGYGYALLCACVQHALSIACRRLDMHRLPENRIMLHLARKAGLSVVGADGQARACIALAADMGLMTIVGASRDSCGVQPAKLSRK